MADEDPPITDNPGDLLMLLDMACRDLRRLRDTDPSNYTAVFNVGIATRYALQHWLLLAAQHFEEPPDGTTH